MESCTCGKIINKKYLKKHLLSKFHLENSNDDKEVIQQENIIENNIEDDSIMNNENEYLSDFNNTFRFDEVENVVKNELKSFRVKKNPSEEELQKYLEIDSILSTSKLDAFISDCIYYILQILETTSQRYPNYNLKGITDALKNNVQFNELMKILSVKYGVFSNTPPEIQMSIIVISTAYLTIMNNRKERDLLEEQLKNNKI